MNMNLSSTNQHLLIEDPGNHPAETVGRLRLLLDGGAELYEDARHESFYEVHDESLVYYVHVSPATGRVYLLATWPKLTASVSA
ncbi:MAG TPA: hypothetical protein VGS20_15900 [Candidatus Acidoferrales bacterium]|nr:hypothetical protein [Candidatus Acidoferrales bacterium]